MAEINIPAMNAVDMIDELQINRVFRYAIVDLEKEEKKAITEKTGSTF